MKEYDENLENYVFKHEKQNKLQQIKTKLIDKKNPTTKNENH